MNILKFVKSSTKFVWRVIKRSTAALVIVLLRFSEIYDEKIRDILPENWRPTFDSVLKYLDSASYWISIAIVIVAVLYTYYEIDKEARDPRITNKLKMFYQCLENLINRSVHSDQDVNDYKEALINDKRDVYDWVKKNMERSALIRLEQQFSGLGGFSVEKKDAFNSEHSELINQTIRAQERVVILIERPVWN